MSPPVSLQLPNSKSLTELIPEQTNALTRDRILAGRDREYPLDAEKEANLVVLLERMNHFLSLYAEQVVVSSGYRPGHYNVKAGGAAKSAHLTCEAVDLVDIDRRITSYILANPSILEVCNLYMENPNDCPSWTHLQIRRPGSGRRIFGK